MIQTSFHPWPKRHEGKRKEKKKRKKSDTWLGGFGDLRCQTTRFLVPELDSFRKRSVLSEGSKSPSRCVDQLEDRAAVTVSSYSFGGRG